MTADGDEVADSTEGIALNELVDATTTARCCLLAIPSPEAASLQMLKACSKLHENCTFKYVVDDALPNSIQSSCEHVWRKDTTGCLLTGPRD